ILIEPMALHLKLPAAELERQMLSLLNVVGLQPFHADRYPHEFSGGQRQRIEEDAPARRSLGDQRTHAHMVETAIGDD
ncbi:hypothetical protein ABTE55_19475, partial [Acinetobacter baumannii]